MWKMSDVGPVGEKVEEEKEAEKYIAEEVNEYTTTRDGGLRS